MASPMASLRQQFKEMMTCNSTRSLHATIPSTTQTAAVINLTEQIQALETTVIVHISCGKEHSVALSNSGNVFAWGAGASGQLGTGELKASFIPKKINDLSRIIQIACGHNHTVALSEDGRVFSWGQNTHGQLGLGEDISSREKPQQVSTLDGIPLAQVAAGGTHSFALSLSGVVYAWGRNHAGQLGLSQTNPKEKVFKPHSVGALRRLDVTFVSCGDEHTAVLTQNGSVFTFGDNSAGQLGHSSSARKAGPQRVDGIDGPVSHLACGSYHTLVHVSASGQLMSFGCGPLRSGTSDRKQDEAPRFNISDLVSPNDLFGIRVKQIFAGPWVSFASTLPTSAAANESTVAEDLPKIRHMDRACIEKWMSVTDSEIHRKAESLQEVKAIFSSPPCLTASFLRPRSSLERYDDIAVDLQKARATFEELAKKEWISRMITDSLINSLIPALPLNSLHKEAFSVFLLLAECMEALSLQLRPECMIGFLESSNVQSLGVHFAKAVTGLHKRSSVILEEYWSLLPESFLDRIVQMIKKAVLAQLCFYRTCSQYQEVIPPLEVLKRLYKVNKVAANKLPVSNFYIDEIYRRINVLTDVQRWNARAEGVLNENAVCLCYFPFVFSPVTKKQIFYWYSSVVQRIIEEKGILAVQNYSQQKQSELPKPTRLFLKVRRHNLVEDALYKLSQVEDSCLRKLLVIQFEGEMPVYEAGSILSEFFLLVFEKMIRPEYKMFMYSEKNSPVWFPPRPSLDKSKYFLFGVLCGLCMFNRVIAYVPFPLATFKKLVGKKPSLDDLKELSPAIGKSLQEILDYEHEDIEEKLQTCYSISWDNVVVDLIQNGSAITVNNKNKKKFVAKYVDYVFNTSVEEIFKEFRRGFYKVVGESIAGFFEPQELMDVMIGNTSYDWNAYEKNAEYCAIYSPTHPTIKMFWEAFHALTLDDKKGFLLFVAGSDRVPMNGMNSLKLRIYHWNCSPPDDYIPQAISCHHILLLPNYSTTEKLKKKILQAIENNQGFGRW
uniref:HECT and RLD domain containing E3 ubiquitin protein ligase family member 6 n=1 Tax=Varanus komodoensis TaxID=61221 RepID=A0A8D2L2Y6_VARKO